MSRSVLVFPQDEIITVPDTGELNKEKTLHAFWSSFGLPAYDESSVPDDAVMPYITYNVVTDSIGSVLPLSAVLWYRTSSWEEISLKSNEIAHRIGYGYTIYKTTTGYLWITKGKPFAQRMSDEDRDVRKMYINITAEFLTAD